MVDVRDGLRVPHRRRETRAETEAHRSGGDRPEGALGARGVGEHVDGELGLRVAAVAEDVRGLHGVRRLHSGLDGVARHAVAEMLVVARPARREVVQRDQRRLGNA